MNIRILSDGKPGHLSQTTGLAHSLVELAGGTISIVDLSAKGFWKRITTACRKSDEPKPDIIIAAGHKTHLPLLFAAKHFGAVSVVCMKPSLPCGIFDLCVVPRHDIPPSKKNGNPRILETIGALNNIRPEPETPKTETLILIGGPSGDFNWNTSSLISQLECINHQAETSSEKTGDIVLTTSRRTPPDVARIIQAACPAIRVIPVEQTKPGWVAQHLAKSKAVWVTEDSVSMVYEALGSGAPVGILSVPRKQKKTSRVLRGLSMLIEEKRITCWDEWTKKNTLAPQPSPLEESRRAAEIIISQFPKLSLS